MGQALPKFSFDEFIAWENAQPDKHEFVRGEVFAMVGARRVHNTLAGNVYASLKQQLKGSPCQAFIETAKLQTAAGDIFYPDVFVTCDPQDLRTEQIFSAPTVIVEVLSPSTQAYDRGLKFTLYRSLPSLREYALVDPDTREVQLFRRGDDGLFTLHDLSGAPQLQFASIVCTVSAEDLFDGIEPIAPAA
jgi:Uma2 family endonuclease